MLLSVIIPVYNTSIYLPKCLNSLICQDMPDGEMEIIIVDDGSTDISPDIICRYTDMYPRMIHAVMQPNCGVSAARNKAQEMD